MSAARWGGVENKLALKLYPGGMHLTWSRLLVAAAVRLTQSFRKSCFCLWWLVLSSVQLLSIFVGCPFDLAPLKEVLPVRSLDHCRCYLFLFPPQGTADWFIWLLYVIMITASETNNISDKLSKMFLTNWLFFFINWIRTDKNAALLQKHWAWSAACSPTHEEPTNRLLNMSLHFPSGQKCVVAIFVEFLWIIIFIHYNILKLFRY